MAKRARLALSADAFIEWAKVCIDGPPRRFVVKENPLPSDAHIVSLDLGNYPALMLVLESEAFDDVPEGLTPPELPPVIFEVVRDDEFIYPVVTTN